MENEIIKHEVAHAPSASEGGDNAYYLKGCEIVGRVPSYASCLFKIREVEAGTKLMLSPECEPEIRAGRCRAAGMREQELLQGVALYYFPRKPPQALTLPYSATGDFGVRITNHTPAHLIPKDPPPARSRFGSAVKKAAGAVMPPKKPAGLQVDAGSYADALNAKPAKKPLTKDDLARLALPGESLVDTAKRLLNKAKGASQ